MDFRPLTLDEIATRKAALERNGQSKSILLMDPKDTSFAGEADWDAPDDNEAVIKAIRSVPCHY